MTSPAAGARPDDDRRTGPTTPLDGAPRRPRRRRGGRGRTSQNTPSQAASGVPAAGDAASPGGATPDSAAPGGAAVDPAGGAAPSVQVDAVQVDVPALRERIAALGLHDVHRLRRRLDSALRMRGDRGRALTTLIAAVDTAETRLAARRAAVPRSPIPPPCPSPPAATTSPPRSATTRS